MGHTGIPTDNAWNESSHSEILKFMHAEYWFLIYKSGPDSRAAHQGTRDERRYDTQAVPRLRVWVV